MRMISLGPFEGNAWLLGRRVERILSEWKEPPRLALVALPFAAAHEELLAAVESAAGVPVVGATTGGASFTERGFSRTGISCAFLGGDNVEVGCAVASDLRTDPSKGVRAALGELEDPRSTRGGQASSILVFSDGFACDGDELVSCLRHNVAPHTRVFGGTAGDDSTFEGGKVFLGSRAMPNAAVLVRLKHRQRLNIDVLHGFRAADRGREFTITDAEKNVLKSLDGQPAAKVYEEELQRLGLRSSSEGLLQAMAKYALGAKTPFGESFKIRTPVGVRGDGALVLTSTLARGQVVRVVTCGSDALIQAAKSLSGRVLGPLETISGALVFCSASRFRLLGDRYREEVRALLPPSGHMIPLFGTTCYGEIAKFGGNIEGFHNTSAVMAGW